MSFVVKPSRYDFSTNKYADNLYLSDDADDSFDFKYVPKSHFKHIIKDATRQRLKKKEDEVRETFLSGRAVDGSDSVEDRRHPKILNGRRITSGSTEETDHHYLRILNAKKITRESTEEADRESESPKEDVPPETKNGISKNSSDDESENGDESPKILLTIPEEINGPSTYERSPVSRLECSSRITRSRSERTLGTKSECSDRFFHGSYDSEYNYSSGSSRRCKSEKEESFDIRPHPAAARKILGIQKKISESLDEIAFRLSTIPIPDGERDLRRRQQRVMEFAVRFSRNYLYDLGRRVADIQRHARAISPSARPKPTRRGISLHVRAMERKLASAHRSLLHALSAYSKHIPSSVLKGRPGKLEEILRVVVDLNEVCSKIHLTNDYYGCGDSEQPPLGKDTENRCNAILSKLRVSSDEESQLVGHATRSTPVGAPTSRNEKRGNKNDNRKRLPARFSMYYAEARLPRSQGSRKSAPLYTRDGRASSVVRKTRADRRPSTPEQPNPSPANYKRGKTKIRLPEKEDEISTMMSTMTTGSDAGSGVGASGKSKPVSIRERPGGNSPCKRSRDSNGSKNEELVVNDAESTKDAKRTTKRRLSSLVPVIADLMNLVKNQQRNDAADGPDSSESVETLMELLKNYRSSANPEISSGKEPNLRRPTSASSDIRNGVKNMRLICLSAGENSRGTLGPVPATANSHNGMTDRPRDSLTPAVTAKNSRFTNLRISEAALADVVKYRDQYQCLSRTNPMYTSNSRNKPWDVVAWIADKLVEELIVDVSKEFQMEQVIKKLFELEFKEF